MKNESLIRIQKVNSRTGLAKSTIWDMVKKDKFPKPIKLSPRVTVWVESEIDEFIENMINKRGEYVG
jgi:prophage regulatory protein